MFRMVRAARKRMLVMGLVASWLCLAHVFVQTSRLEALWWIQTETIFNSSSVNVSLGRQETTGLDGAQLLSTTNNEHNLKSSSSNRRPMNESWSFATINDDRLSPLLHREAMELARQRQRELENGIQRIYYINLDKNVKRRRQMEYHLSKVKSDRGKIPFLRFPALVGPSNGTICELGKQDPARCRGIVGLSRSMIQLMDTQNTTGMSLVLEDDFILGHNLTKIEQAIQIVPDDWDIIRLVCWGQLKYQNTFVPIPNPSGLDLYEVKRSNESSVCGGTHAMVWRESSLHKIHRAWSRRPYTDIDCRLGDEPGLKSYCLGRRGKKFKYMFLGRIESPSGEGSNIPKIVEVSNISKTANS
ncbi:hypothetical protein ACA910_000477 [Epithemia clementina (nom. ined.)]